MTALTLHFAPDSCARVPLIALEEIGIAYKLEVVAFMKGQHRLPEYLKLNPKGKVPTLIVDGEPLTENVAILDWLSTRFPEANLIPRLGSSFEHAKLLADLAYCASGLHPIVTRLRIPQTFCDTSEGARRVFELAEVAMRQNFDVIEHRLAAGNWWYGDQWSIVDAYINWVWFRVGGTRFNSVSYKHFSQHNLNMAQRPAVARALAISDQVSAGLAEDGLAVRFVDPFKE